MSSVQLILIVGDLGELEDQSFYDTIEETCEKLNDHLMDLGPKVYLTNLKVIRNTEGLKYQGIGYVCFIR